jgi:tartrate dehydratase alpha subunit/fumarate hydratase class I-like protein
MKKRYLSIIALAFVFGIATVFTSCGSDEQDAKDAAAEIENALNQAMEEAVETVDSTTQEAVDAVDSTATEANDNAAEETTEEEVK